MKKIIITVFLSLLITPTFAQIRGQFKLDTTLKNVYRNTYSHEMSKNFNRFRTNPLQSDNFVTPYFLKRKYISLQNPTMESYKSKNYEEMPCMIPEGYSPMKILTPDSSKRYSLLIKQL